MRSDNMNIDILLFLKNNELLDYYERRCRMS